MNPYLLSIDEREMIYQKIAEKKKSNNLTFESEFENLSNLTDILGF